MEEACRMMLESCVRQENINEERWAALQLAVPPEEFLCIHGSSPLSIFHFPLPSLHPSLLYTIFYTWVHQAQDVASYSYWGIP